MWAWLIVGVVGAPPAWGAPTVPRTELEIVPVEWRASWDPLQRAVETARANEAESQRKRQEADQAWRAADDAANQAKRTLDEREKLVKAARKQPSQAAGAASARALAFSTFQAASRQEKVARGDRDLALAAHELAIAERDLAEAQLEQARAQSVADAGGWAEVARFDAAVVDAKQRVALREAAQEQARSRAALWAQGGGGG
jgi:hypothetical protein